MTVGVEHNIESSGSVRFVHPDSSVRVQCQTLWVCSVWFGIALECGSSSVCSVWVRNSLRMGFEFSVFGLGSE